MKQESFTILLTTDQNLRYQQNLEQAGVAVVVMIAPKNRLSDLIPLIPETKKALDVIIAGDVVEVGLS
jgi:hypothetical protein